VCIVFGSNGVAFGESLQRLVGHGLEAKRVIQWLWITFHSDWSLCGFVEKFIYASIHLALLQKVGMNGTLNELESALVDTLGSVDCAEILLNGLENLPNLGPVRFDFAIFFTAIKNSNHQASRMSTIYEIHLLKAVSRDDEFDFDLVQNIEQRYLCQDLVLMGIPNSLKVTIECLRYFEVIRLLQIIHDEINNYSNDSQTPKIQTACDALRLLLNYILKKVDTSPECI